MNGPEPLILEAGFQVVVADLMALLFRLERKLRENSPKIQP